MKLNNLLESYFPGLYHISHKKDLTKENLKIPSLNKMDLMSQKPSGGFWLAKGLSWHNWSVGAGFRDTGEQYLYRVKINPKAKIFVLKKKTGGLLRSLETPRKQFMRAKDSDIFGQSISFEKIIKQYDGIRVYRAGSIKMWDVPTVVIFNKKAIDSIEPLGLVKDAIKKSKAK